MNIFYLDRSPSIAAQYHCDKHVVKMILEYAQLMSTAHVVLDNEQVAYKSTHKNHPSAIWARQSDYNYRWLYELFRGVCVEYTSRYGKIHMTESKFSLTLSQLPKNITMGPFTNPPQCMPDKYKGNDTVIAYQSYYNGEKVKFAKWKNGNTPPWFKVENN